MKNHGAEALEKKKKNIRNQLAQDQQYQKKPTRKGHFEMGRCTGPAYYRLDFNQHKATKKQLVDPKNIQAFYRSVEAVEFGRRRSQCIC